MLINDILEAYAAVARPIMRQWWSADSCIAATRVTVNVLQVFGIPCRALPVKCLVYNPQYQQYLNERDYGDDGPSPEVVQQWLDRDAWCVALGFTGQSGEVAAGRYDGHLVAIAAECYLIDAAIDQAQRPHKNINLPDIVMSPVRPEFFTGKAPSMGVNEHGVLVSYNPNPDAPDYTTAPDWCVAEPAKHGLVEIAILRAMQREHGVPLDMVHRAVLLKWRTEVQRALPKSRRRR